MMGMWRWGFGWEDYGLRGMRWEGGGLSGEGGGMVLVGRVLMVGNLWNDGLDW